MTTAQTAAAENRQVAHTPGPWKIDPRYSAEPVQEVYAADGLVAATYSGGVGVVDADPHRRLTAAQTRANARLIAAAPDLLDELSRSQAALDAALRWIADNAREVNGAATIAAMLNIQSSAAIFAIRAAE